MLKIEHISLIYNNVEVAQDINLEIEDGDCIAIVGENGAGKTTLLKYILGINKLTVGNIYIDNIHISKYKKWQNFGYVAQKNNLYHDIPLTVKEYLKLYVGDLKKIKELIVRFDVEKFLSTKIVNLSGGQFQRVNIVKALVNDIKYLILDEPESGLDVEVKQEFYKLIKELNKKGITIIFVTHNLDSLIPINKVYDMKTRSLRII